LDHNENMAQLHLSRKQIKSPQDEALLVSSALNCNFSSKTNLDIRNSVINQATGIAVVAPLDDDVGDLEMLLESYFMQLDGIRNRIMMVCSSLPNLYWIHHTRPRHSLILQI
jgi:magnesium transporter